jgi:hypothetical protein
VPARTQYEIDRIRASIERIGGLSDNVIGVGPLKIGLDGILAWIPGVGTVYSLGAAGMLIVQGVRAKAPFGALFQVVTLLGIRTLVTSGGEAASLLTMLPITIPAELAVDFFRAHKWSADILLKAIDKTVYVEGRRHASNPNYADIKEQVRSGGERRRVVFLG